MDDDAGLSAPRSAAEDVPANLRLLADAMPQIVWTARPDGGLDYCNRRWYDYTGATFAQTKDWGWETVLHPDDQQHCHERSTQAVATGKPYEIEYRLKRADGIYRWHLGRAVPVRDAAGRLLHWVGTGTDIDDRKRAEQETQAFAEREALVNRISQAIRSTLSPDLIQETVAEALGEALGAGRCFFAVCDQAQDLIHIGRDFRRDGLPSLMGAYPLAGYEDLLSALFPGPATVVIEDVRDAPLSGPAAVWLEQQGFRALLAVPLFNGGRLMAALWTAMVDTPRAWTPAEVTLAEEVATLTRAALELARVHQRESHIAAILQGALQPTPPDKIPGLDIAAFYTAALEEANVGGDFFDVFPVEKGCYALTVGDVSGKGLQAAAQVATLRNMLRYAVYTGRTIAEGVTRLNDILIANNLLTGFATLVVVTFDMAMKTLTYVSCGQEPALLRRTAAGHVEELPPTGPVLGASETAVYGEHIVPLRPGDVFALYTDGLTEAGPNRREMLGVAGVAELLRDSRGSAQDVVNRITEGALQHAQGRLTDDVCLLIGIAESGSAGG